MKVKRIELDNYKALAGKHEFDMNGCSFFLMGGNGQGKTSVGRLVMDILTKNLPTQPVTEGEKQGYVEITLDNGDKIYYRFNDTGSPILEIIAANGGKFNNVAELFKTMAGEGMKFDINEFLKLSPKPRRAMLEKIAGVDFASINENERQAEDSRKAINARLKDARARVVPFDHSLLEKAPVNITELSEKLSAAQAHNQKVVNALSEIARVGEDNHQITNLLVELSQKIKECELKIVANQNRIELGNKWLEENPSHPEDLLASFKNELSKADEINRGIEKAKTAQKDFEFAQDMEGKSTAAEMEVKRIRAEKDTMIQSAKLPADGLSFSSDGETLLIDGLPFEDAQIATSRKMICAIQIAESMLGSIKFLHLDGSVLDKENATNLLNWSESKGLQLAVERSIWEGGDLKFEIFETSNTTSI
jgi:recombinational DNA repair ATPase RecF